MTAAIAAGQNDFYLYAKNNTEYFIIENRQQQSRDASLLDSGLAIWHIDELGSNNNEQMTADFHYECSLEQADNRFDLEHRGQLWRQRGISSVLPMPCASPQTQGPAASGGTVARLV